MKVLAETTGSSSDMLIVTCSKSEWDDIRELAGVPYDRRSHTTGTVYDIKEAREALRAFHNMKEARKSMLELYRKWEKTLTSLDAVLAAQKPE